MPTWKARIANLWSESEKVAERRLPFALFVAALLAYAAAFAWHTLANFDIVTLIGPGNADDSFYYFQIAYNLAQGKFSTFDGGITQTNGYHPVWLLLITPLYWLFDKETALFGIKALEIMLVAGGMALIALAAWLARLAWPLLFAALPTLYRNPLELLWGLEAAAAMFALALLILAVCLYMRHPERWKWHLAAIAFALPWVRLEYIAVSLAATAALCAIEWSRQERRAISLSELANFRRAYIPPIGAAAGILVYFAYNRLAFGGALPVNALTKQAWSQNKWAREGGYDFIQNFGDTLRLGVFDHELLIALEICAYLLIAWRLALRSNDRRDWLLTAFLAGVFGLAAGHIAKFAQSVLIMHPDDAYRIWYFVPAYLMTALIIPIRLYVAIYLIRRFLAPRRRIAANALSVGVVVIGAAFLLARSDFAEPFRWVDQKSEDIYYAPHIASYMGVQVMNGALPEGSVIGVNSAGIIGYFSRFPVVNLDGLVNSYEHFHARHIRRTEGLDFYRRYGVTHLVNHVGRHITDDNMVFEGAPTDKLPGSGFRIWLYDSPLESSGKTSHSYRVWERMKPRFDYLSNGVGVVLNGRMAQAIAKDCRPDELLIWTWSEQNHDRTLIEPNPYRSPTNMCVAAQVLPRGANRQAQAKMTTLNAYLANLTASREPIIRSDFDVYINEGILIYTKSHCSQDDATPKFFANMYPVDTDDLPASIRIRQRGYQTISFNLNDYGAIAADGQCWATLNLPNYPITQIHAGQYVEFADGYAHIWEGAYRFDE